jgi:hypothetical protein
MVLLERAALLLMETIVRVGHGPIKRRFLNCRSVEAANFGDENER